MARGPGSVGRSGVAGLQLDAVPAVNPVTERVGARMWVIAAHSSGERHRECAHDRARVWISRRRG